MSGFDTVPGFEEVWRPIALRKRTPQGVLGRLSPEEIRQKLSRLVGHAPEVVVIVTGAIHSAKGLKAQLAYISRKGEIDLECDDGLLISGRADVLTLAQDWATLAELDSRRTTKTRLSLSMVLSMPAGTDAGRLMEASRTFAMNAFGDRFDYVLAMHLDAANPHVHLTVRALGRQGERLKSNQCDLDAWRSGFAEALRSVGVDAEATPRRTRGLTRKGEHQALYRLRMQFEAGGGPMARVIRPAYQEAAQAAFHGDDALRPWEVQMVARQRKIRTLYIEQARLLEASDDMADRRLGAALAAFVSALPPPDSRRLEFARTLRAAKAEQDREAGSVTARER